MDKTNSILRCAVSGLLLGGVAGACSSGGSASPYPYEADTTTVIGAQGSGTSPGGSSLGSGGAGASKSGVQVGLSPVATYSTATPSGGDCLDIQGVCAKPQDQCDAGGTADVIVGPDGAVLSVICYPNRDYHVVVLGDAPVSSPPLGNNTVVVIDGKDDGVDIQGDLTIQGNNVILYGYGPETSVIGGNLNIDKNNAIVRGVRIDGNASITKNNAALIDCVIEGDLTISGNNVSLALCEIWGNVKIEGNNAVFVSNLVLGDQPISGDNLRCNDNHRFADANQDGLFQSSEIAGAVTCESRGQSVMDTANLAPKKP
jgi:hypothetical protein